MMKRFLVYTGLQIKRALRYLPFILLISVVLCLTLSLAIYTLVDNDSKDENNQKLKIGIVGEFADSYFEFGVSAIQSLDSSRFAMEIIDMTEDQAKVALKAREIVGYVIIPEGYIIDAVTGEVERLAFVTNQNGIDMFTLFKEEVLDLISCMVVESQNGVYSMQDIIVEYQVERENLYDHTTALSTEYVGLIFNRSNTIKTEVIGVSDNLSFGGYMFSGISILLLMLCGIICCPLFTRRDISLAKLLRANRCGSLLQTISEYISYLFVMTAGSLLLLSFMTLFAGKVLGIIPELSNLPIYELLFIHVKLIPSLIAITSLQFLLFELSDSVISGVLLQFITTMGLAYISGCLYPISFFPESIQKLSAFTPSGVARGYFSSLLSGGDVTVSLLGLAFFAIIFIALSALVRHRRIKTA